MARHIPRLYCEQPLAPNLRIELTESQTHHLQRVLRIKPGAALILFDGSEFEYPAEAEHVDRHQVVVRTAEPNQTRRESPLPIRLLQAIIRNERMDLCIGKAVELGVAQIQPLMLERSQGMDKQRLARKQQHWRGLVQSATEQCGRTRLPAVADACQLSEVLTPADTGELRLILHPRLPARSLPRLAPTSVSLLVGPEGGLTETELHMAEAAGYTGLSLGPRILRTETATIAALTLLQARWGDLQD